MTHFEPYLDSTILDLPGPPRPINFAHLLGPMRLVWFWELVPHGCGSKTCKWHQKLNATKDQHLRNPSPLILSQAQLGDFSGNFGHPLLDSGRSHVSGGTFPILSRDPSVLGGVFSLLVFSGSFHLSH